MNLEERHAAFSVLLDFSQAFGTVVRGLLSLIMTNGKLQGSYLSNRTQFVRTAGEGSDTRETEYGVPQGSVLLYICYSNDVTRVIEFCRFHTSCRRSPCGS
jgi:hypothetical protein